jgi:hypothetical protein
VTTALIKIITLAILGPLRDPEIAMRDFLVSKRQNCLPQS